LDDILSGGLTRHRLYLLEGMPDPANHAGDAILLEGAQKGESILYVTLSETRRNSCRCPTLTVGPQRY
jgi:circadian clock protein KaiC